MANPLLPLPGGICFNSSHKGLLDLEKGVLNHLIDTRPIENLYDVQDTPFARGKFASVKKSTHKETGIEYAAKFIRKRRRAMDHRQIILHEVAVLKITSDCSKIVTLHEVFETRSEIILVLELAAGGELQRLVDVQEGLAELETIEILKQILQGVQFLHNRNIAHLDIKPQNILLTKNHPGSEVKLCDFGISRIIQNGVDVREILGTPDYVATTVLQGRLVIRSAVGTIDLILAPEILSYEPISLETDIWSIGVLAYVLLTGYSPFGGETKQETFCNISQCNLSFPEEFFSSISSSAQDFIRQTLVTKPSKRLNVSQCLLHPWLMGISAFTLTYSNKLLKNRSSHHHPCPACSQCKTVVKCPHHGWDETESKEKSQVSDGLKSHFDVLLNRDLQDLWELIILQYSRSSDPNLILLVPLKASYRDVMFKY